jgi:hypothetical protein
MDPWRIAVNVLVKVNFLFLSKLDLIVLPHPNHHLQKILLWLWLHIALHKIAEELLYPDWRWFFEECWRIYFVWWIAQLGKQLSHVRWYFNLKYMSWGVVQVVISKCHWHISCNHSSCVGCKIVAGDYVPSYQSRKWLEVKCFKVECFQEGVQNLMRVSSPTTTFYMPSHNNSLVIIFKQKAKEKFCTSAILFYIPQ